MSSTRVRSLVAVVLAAMSVAVAVPVERAQARIGEIRAALSIQPTPGDSTRCNITVGSFLSTTEGEARFLKMSGHKIVVRVWGQDLGTGDDLLIGPRLAHLFVGARGLDFRMGVSVLKNVLNEDTPPGPGDEIYAGVRLLNPTGETIRSATTYRLTGQFGPFEANTCDNTVLN